MLSAAMNPEIGMMPPHALPQYTPFFVPPPARPAPPKLNAFARLVAVYKENEVLLSELRSLHSQLESAKAYLRSPVCHCDLAEAQILRIRSKQHAARAFLRANRIRANEFVKSRDLESAI